MSVGSTAKTLLQNTADRVTISNGASVSGDSYAFVNMARGSVLVPSAWTTADISFEFGVRDMNGNFTWSKVRTSAGALVKITGVTVSSHHTIPADVFNGGPLAVRLVSTNTASEAAVNQGAERQLVVYLKS